jgi:hypothetical protein
MAAAQNLSEARPAVHDHDPQSARIGVEFLFVEHHGRRMLPARSSLRPDQRRDEIRLGQFMVTANDFLESFTAIHDFEEQAARVGMSFPFVDEIAFFETHEQRLPFQM